MAGWRFFLNGTEVEEPIGWDGVEFTAIRSENHGVDQPFSTAIKFYGKGAQILKEAFDTFFVSAQVSLLITSDQLVNGLPYQYSGVIDFSTYEEINTCDTDSWSVSVGILQDSFRDKFKARYDVEVDLFGGKDLDGNSIPDGESIARQIRMHSQKISLQANGGTLAQRVGYVRNQDLSQSPPSCSFGQGWFDCLANTTVPTYWDNSDFEGIFGTTFDNGDPAYNGQSVMFKNNGDGDRLITISWEAFTVSYEFSFSNAVFVPIPLQDQSMNLALSYTIWNDDTNFQFRGEAAVDTGLSFYVPFGFPPQPPRVWNIPAGSITVPVAVDQRLSLSFTWGVLGSIQNYYTSLFSNEEVVTTVVIPEGVKISLREENISYASLAQGIPVFSFLNRIIYQLTGNANGLLSNCFNENTNGDLANNVITTGLLLRRWLPPEGQNIQIKTSFKKAFQNLAAIFGLGWAFELQADGSYKLRVEPYEYFYKNIVQITLPNVEELKRSAVTDKFYGQLKLGFADNWKNMSLGGLDAICTDRNYFLDNRAISNGSTSTLEMQSEIIAEGIAIEYSRRLQFFDTNSGSSDRPNDYQFFIVWTIRQDITIPEGINNNPEYRFDGETGAVTLEAYRASWASNLINGSSSRWGDSLYRYNLYHTSARVALRQWSMLGMNTYGMQPAVWRYQVGQYKTRFSSAVNSTEQPYVIEDTSLVGFPDVLLAEDGNIQPSVIKLEYQPYLLKPIIYEFEYPQAFCDFIQLANYTPYRKVKVTIGSFSVSGWILDIKNKPEDNSGGTTVFRIIGANIADPEPPPPPTSGAYSDAYSNAYN